MLFLILVRTLFFVLSDGHYSFVLSSIFYNFILFSHLQPQFTYPNFDRLISKDLE
jgi:hypothetical protein